MPGSVGGEAAEMSGPRAARSVRWSRPREGEVQLRQSEPLQRSDGTPAGISPRRAADFPAEAERLRREATYHLRDRPMSDADNWRLRNELGWHHDRGNLLRFLDDPSIEPTNNRAERALRPAVIARKVSHCSKNVGGADAFSAFTSVIRTLARNGGDHTLVNGLCGVFSGAPVPTPSF